MLLCLLFAVVDDYGIVFDGGNKERHSSVRRLSRLRSPDVPIACPLVDDELPHVFPAPLHPLSGQITGFAFNIYNNIWIQTTSCGTRTMMLMLISVPDFTLMFNMCSAYICIW